MPDDNSGDNGSGDDTKTLRGKYEALLARVDGIEADKVKAERALAISQSGVKNLSPRRQRAIMRELEEDKLDFTPENIREVAIDLNFAKPEDFKDDGKGQQGQQQGDQGQQTLPPNSNPDLNGNGAQTPPDPYSHYRDNSDGRMFGMNNLANQGVPAGSQITSAAQFDAAMKGAQSPEELDAIIRQSGGQFGVALEEDMM